MAGVEDEVLIRRVAAGDDRALEGLYDRYAGLVYGTGTRYLGERGAAEDLVQDVFLSVWRNAGTYDPSRASFSTWIYRITRNRATDLIRRRKSRVRTVGAGPSDVLYDGAGVAQIFPQIGFLLLIGAVTLFVGQKLLTRRLQEVRA